MGGYDLINTQLLLISLMAIGIITVKAGLVDKHDTGVLSNLIIYLLLPCNILSSFIGGSSKNMLRPFISVAVISVCVTSAGYFLGKHVFFRRMHQEQKKVLCYSTLISNATFLGNPVVESIYGAQALLYSSIYLLPIRVLMWTVGLALFTGGIIKIQKILLHPCLVATYIGLLFMFTGWPLPAFIPKVILTVGNCTTAFSMIVVGNILARVSPKGVITKTILWYSFLRLVVIPLTLFGILFMLHTDPLVMGVTVVLSGMPSPSTVSIMAEKYGGDSALASKIILVSVLLSMLTIPALVLLIRFV
jgi:predicted permease